MRKYVGRVAWFVGGVWFYWRIPAFPRYTKKSDRATKRERHNREMDRIKWKRSQFGHTAWKFEIQSRLFFHLRSALCLSSSLIWNQFRLSQAFAAARLCGACVRLHLSAKHRNVHLNIFISSEPSSTERNMNIWIKVNIVKSWSLFSLLISFILWCDRNCNSALFYVSVWGFFGCSFASKLAWFEFHVLFPLKIVCAVRKEPKTNKK